MAGGQLGGGGKGGGGEGGGGEGGRSTRRSMRRKYMCKRLSEFELCASTVSVGDDAV